MRIAALLILVTALLAAPAWTSAVCQTEGCHCHDLLAEDGDATAEHDEEEATSQAEPAHACCVTGAHHAEPARAEAPSATHEEDGAQDAVASECCCEYPISEGVSSQMWTQNEDEEDEDEDGDRALPSLDVAPHLHGITPRIARPTVHTRLAPQPVPRPPDLRPTDLHLLHCVWRA